MINYWKQFAESATAFANSPFKLAYFRLTAAYAVIVIVIFSIFGIATFFGFGASVNTIKRDCRANHDGATCLTSEQCYGALKDGIGTTVVPLGVEVFLLTTGLAYLFASKTLKPIQDSMWTRKRFTADAAHDLRTPLSIMKMNLELMGINSNPTKEEMNELVISNLEEVDRMTRIIEDLMTISSIDNIKSNMPFSKIDLLAVAESAIREIKPAADRKSITLVSALEPATMNGNRNALERMILNLLRNAVEYTPEKGKIELSVSVNDKIILTVADNGAGIDSKDLPHVFERFYKGEIARKKKIKGSGLGLAIVKEIVNKHKGSARIESVLNRGTKVIVEFPR
jgi:two-component system, OmpR family, sensor histidine kinase CiaH